MVWWSSHGWPAWAQCYGFNNCQQGGKTVRLFVLLTYFFQLSWLPLLVAETQNDNCLSCCFVCSSSRMVLLKGVDKQTFVWYVTDTLLSQWNTIEFFRHRLIVSCTGTQIMAAGRHMTYLKILMQHSFSIGMRWTVRWINQSPHYLIRQFLSSAVSHSN